MLMPGQTTNLLIERLRAWKHVCGNLEDYMTVTSKISKSQSKDHEKILKVGGCVCKRAQFPKLITKYLGTDSQ